MKRFSFRFTLAILCFWHAISFRPALAQAPQFTDVPDTSWFAPYVYQAAKLGIVNGYKNEQGDPTRLFRPEDPVSIAQGLKMGLEAIGIDVHHYQLVSGQESRSDLQKVPSLLCHEWWCIYYQIARLHGIGISGCTAVGGFEPDRPMRRWEMAKLIADVYQLQPSGTVPSPLPNNPYSDVDQPSSIRRGVLPYAPTLADDTPKEWSTYEYMLDPMNRFAILRLAQDNVMTGDDAKHDGALRSFRPLDTLNRAEAVKVVLSARRIYRSIKPAPATIIDLPDTPPLPCAG